MSASASCNPGAIDGSDDDPLDAERGLIRAAQHDLAAFDVLYRRHYPIIHRSVRRRCPADAVDDIVSDTFATALQALPRFEARGVPFRHWLHRIATSRIHRWWRRQPKPPVVSLQDVPVRPATRRADQDVAQDTARWALARLPARLQAPLALHYLEGLAVEEVAALTRCPIGTVKSRLARGRDAMRRVLRSAGEHPHGDQR